MRETGNWAVPHRHGEYYPDKPPLMFWLINAGWLLTGLNEWWPRIVQPLFSLAALLLTARVARRLWPGNGRIAGLACLVLASLAIWDAFMAALMFDTMIATFALIAALGVLRAASDGRWRGWLVAGAAIGFGILAKGPIILLHVLPLALLAPWWSERAPPGGWRRWYGGIAAAIAIGAAIALAWALPAAHAGGPKFARAIFWGQTAERVVDAFAHRRAFYWYLPLLPLLLFPWILWPALWRGAGRVATDGPDPGMRVLVAWAVPAFVGLSAISGKQIHYLVPLAPVVALFAARFVDVLDRGGVAAGDEPEHLRPLLVAFLLLAVAGVLALNPSAVARAFLPADGGATAYRTAAALCAIGLALAVVRPRSLGSATLALGTASVAVLLVLMLVPLRSVYERYDVAPTARVIGGLVRDGHPVAYVGRYHDQYQFFGRLTRPLDEIEEDGLPAWAREHPDGVVVTVSPAQCDDGPGAPIHAHPYLGKAACIFPASAFVGGREGPPGSAPDDPSHV
jgi:4-amino-4-deoxy-L-arabinose transferase-like glycosyltransferase